MKAEELRIGNYVQDVDTERKGIIKRIYGNGLSVKLENSTLYQHFEKFQPILLSEEVLLKFGFSKLAKEVFSKTENDEFKSTFIINWDEHLNLFKVAFTGFWYEIRYLHQLQNLYLALTGKELEIKL